MTDEEFERLYGRKPVRPGTHTRVKVYWGRIIIALIVLVLIICGLWQLIRSIVNHFKKGDTTPSVVTAVTNTDTSDVSVPDESKIETPPVQQTKTYEFKVCIDPGHGGEDGGACVYNDDGSVLRAEKDDTLRISKAVAEYLKSEGVQVVMTRDEDMLLGTTIEEDLNNRCTIANDARCDLFVSLHRDSVSTDASGFECWIHNKKPEMDYVLASNIMTNLQGVGISSNRGVQTGYTNDRDANYHVNADVVCPSVLCELGFITSKIDNDFFDKNLQKYAEAIGKAIIKTAQDLGVVNSEGKRQLNEQLISRSKLYFPLESYYSDTNASRRNSFTQR